MRWLAFVLAFQVVLGGTLVALAATDNIPALGLKDADEGSASAAQSVPRAKAARFNGRAAYASVKRQVAIGPRPAGSAASRRLAVRLRRSLPRGRVQSVPGGLRNVVGVVPGRERKRIVVVGAHYDTKDQAGFVGANDGASGVAVLTQLAHTIRPRRARSTLVFVAFDGEESPRGTPSAQFEEKGLRGSKVAAVRYRKAKAMVLLDYVGQRGLRVPFEDFSNTRLWSRLRASARRVGVGKVFPGGSQGGIYDDHVPFIRQKVPSIDLIDFDYACFHRTCDDLSQISALSLDAVGETLTDLLPRL